MTAILSQRKPWGAFRVALLMLAAAATVPFAAADAASTETKLYGRAPVPVGYYDAPVGFGVNGVSFDVPAGATEAAITVEDLTGLPQDGFYAFLDGDTPLADGRFCGSVTVDVPDGADRLAVQPGPNLPVGAEPVCPGAVHWGTVGTVTVATT